GGCVVHFLDETNVADAAVLRASLFHEDTIVASDAIAPIGLGAGAEGAWPLPPAARTHPPAAGTVARSFLRLGGDGQVGFLEFVSRASLLPARVIASAAGATLRKGTLTVGADADVVVFDSDAFHDRATYAASTQLSAGVRHLLVGGEPVIRDGTLAQNARPGRPVRKT